MAYVPLEELLPQAGGSIYKLIHVAVKRAMELADGKPCLLEKVPSDKLATIALEEIRSGKIALKGAAEKKSKLKKADHNPHPKEGDVPSEAMV